MMELVGVNTKWYRYQNNINQEQFANKTKFKITYVITIENSDTNLTCENIDFITKAFNIKQELLFNEETVVKTKKLPNRVDMYYKCISFKS